MINETTQPITNICLVTKPNNVPTNFHCIRKSNEKRSTEFIRQTFSSLRLAHDDPNRDADLMADSLMGRKDRFLCICRGPPVDPRERSLVLEDIRLISDREQPPASYSPLLYTCDTREKATARKLICVKLVDQQAGMKCISDILFLYRSKRPPQFYTVIGEINGLQMCVREGNVPALRVAPPVPPPISSIPSAYPQDLYRPPSQLHTHLTEYGTAGTLTKKSDEKEILEGIPFTINSKYLRSQQKSNGLDGFDNFRILSPYEIEQQFHYDFHLERASSS